MKPVITVTLNPAIDKTVLVEKLIVGGLNRAIQNSEIDPGGKGINVAKVLHEFNNDVIASGFIAGQQGNRLMQKLNHLGIENKFLEVQGETRTNLKIVDQSINQTTELNELGFHVTEKDLVNFNSALNSLLSNASFLVLGGSYPQGVPYNIYYQYIKLAKAYGVKVILDAEGDAMKEGIKATPYAIKPNLFELEGIVGRKLATIDEIVQSGLLLIKQGIKIVVVSLGKEGSIVMDDSLVYRVKPFEVKANSTVGAGDSMVAAIVYSILQNKSLEDLARWASSAGSITASKSGTKVCTLTEVKGALDRVQLSTIN